MFLTMSAVYYNHEAAFFPMDTAMNHPGSTGAFGHLLLFIGIAWLFKLAIPGLSARRYAMFLPVMIYHNFQRHQRRGVLCRLPDAAVPKKYLPYILVYSLGLWNHETLSMVTGVAFVYLWLEGDRKKAISLAAVQGAIFLLYRAAVQFFLPYDRVVTAGLAQNLHPIATYGLQALFFAGMKLMLPIGAAVLAYRYAPRFLKIALLVHFAALALGTVLYGRLDEARQWNTMFAIILTMTVIFVDRIIGAGEPVQAVPDATERFSAVNAD